MIKRIKVFGVYVILLGSCTIQATTLANAAEAYRADQADEGRCKREQGSDMWLDKLQANTHTNLCRTVRWVDSLFGNSEKFDTDGFSGRVVVGLREDEEDGFDPRLRIRIKSKLPNVSKRFNAFIGRVDEEAFVTENAKSGEHVVSRNTISRTGQEDASWLIGLGYSQNRDRGFDVSVGAKISGGLNPYALGRYRYLVNFDSPHYLNLTQTVFWRRDERYGVSSSADYSYSISNNDILGWGTGVKFTTEQDFWEASSTVTWYHKFDSQRGVATRIYARDSEEYSASLPEYGASITYRRPFLRNWCFIEFGLENRWEKAQREDPRESFTRFGIQVEMQFGKHYKKHKRRH